VTLVDKGVSFDTGALDIKPESAMALMKKDMGGAAAALALAFMIMDAELPVRLRAIIPIVENAISASAMGPGDIFRSRKGFSIEIGDTDGEGRLILADALALADEEAPGFRHFYRCGARRPRPRFATLLHNGRNACRRHRADRHRCSRSGLAAAVVGTL
jgi:hypothetical protein